MKRIIGITILIMVCIFIFANSAISKVIFYDNCEDRWNSTDWSASGNGGKNLLEASGERFKAGRHSYKFKLAPYPTSGSKTNVELILRAIKNRRGNANFNFEQEYWMGWSLYIPSDFTSPSGRGIWCLAGQFHGAPDGKKNTCDTKTRNPVLAFFFRPGSENAVDMRLSLIAEVDKCTKSAGWSDRHVGTLLHGLKRGAWNDFVLHFKWSYTSSGFFQIWLNGEQFLDDKGPNCFNDKKGPYFKMGLYGHLKVATTVYYDEIRVGDSSSSYAEVAPAGTKTPAGNP